MVTKKEIAILFRYTEYYINQFFEAAAKEQTPLSESIRRKSKGASKMKAANYTLEESLYAMTFCRVWNPAMAEYLKENFIDREGDYLDRTGIITYVNQDAVEFCKEYIEYYHKIKCCNTCTYCVSQQPNMAGTRDRPFCDFYGKFITKMGMNVYKDHCKTYALRKTPPRLWEINLPKDIEGFYKATKNCWKRKVKRQKWKQNRQIFEDSTL